VSSIVIYTSIAFITGFLLAWLLRTITAAKLKKKLHSTDGLWQREKLMKETAQKESKNAYAAQAHLQQGYEKKIQQLQKAISIMDTDILLLQKNNEETEVMLKAGKPELHHLKLQLIEANNTIARYKAQSNIK
jgi:hypothetical protein